ncbi:MAG: hypothetical protein ACREFL_18965 [Stellaceae bacterium]
MIAISACAQAAGAPHGYRIHQQVVLDADATGLSGKLQILEDDRIPPMLRREMWGKSYMLDMILDDSDPVRRQFEKAPMSLTHLRLADASGRVLHDETLEVPLAEIKVAYLYGNRFPTYLVTADYSTGLGSYNGPVTRFVEIRNGRFGYIRLAEAPGKDDLLTLMRSLKTDWRILRSQHGKSATIQSVSCRPDFATENDFITTYSTYRFDGTRWHRSSRQSREFWESDAENFLAPARPSDWPEARLFP